MKLKIEIKIEMEFFLKEANHKAEYLAYLEYRKSGSAKDSFCRLDMSVVAPRSCFFSSHGD